MQNLARLRETQTPLFGGENPDLHPSDFSGVTPKKKDIQTPNPIATPLRTPSGATGTTPRLSMTPAKDVAVYGMTPKGTPIRDELHINEGMDTPSLESSKAEKLRQVNLQHTFPFPGMLVFLIFSCPLCAYTSVHEPSVELLMLYECVSRQNFEGTFVWG
jgi:hypothetical protein